MPVADVVLSNLAKTHEMGAGAVVLNPDDIVGFTFLLATGMMLASTLFFFLERFSVPAKWAPSMTLAGLVTGIAFWNYCYMREAWLSEHESPLVYRYADWIITVPLQVVEFYFILSASVDNLSIGVLWNLIISSVGMLVFGYLGEAGIAPMAPMWCLGMVCWLYVIYYTFAGEAGQLVSGGKCSAGSKQAFETIRLIVTVGWVIYPIGYLVGMSGMPGALAWLNGIYNVADLVNKTAFGLAIYGAARVDMANMAPAGYQAA